MSKPNGTAEAQVLIEVVTPEPARPENALSSTLKILQRFFGRTLHDPNTARTLLEHRLRKLTSLGRSIMLLPFRRLVFAEIHWTTEIAPHCEFRSRRNVFLAPFVQIRRGVVMQASPEGQIVIGARSQINPYTVIYGGVKIGSAVMIAPHVMLAAGNHGSSRLDIPMMDQGDSSRGIKIEDDVWIGANCVVLDGVTIHRGAIVAAGAVVKQDVEAFSVVTGVPARKKKMRLHLAGDSVPATDCASVLSPK